MRSKGLCISAAVMAGALLYTCSAQAASEDILGNLNTALKGLEGDAPVKGVIVVTSRSVEDGDDPKKPVIGHLQLDFAAGDGLTLHMRPELLQQIDAEELRNASDPEQKEPTVDLLRSMGPTRIGHMVSAARALLVILDGASELASKPGTFDGAPATELSMHLPARLSKKDSSNAKDYRENASIWLDAQGTPLGFHETAHAKFCKFFLCITVDRSRDMALRVIDGRLVAVSSSEELKQSGLGQGSDTLTTVALQLQ